MTEERPVSKVTELVKQKLDDALVYMGGLDDKHLQVLSYYLKYEMRLSRYRFRTDFKSTPKTLTIHVLDKDGAEIFIKPKNADLFDKMIQYLKLDQWVVKFAERGEK